MALEKPGSTDNGQTLRDEIEANAFTGVSGVKFNLSQGQLDQSELEVYNVVGDRERIIGNWSPERGLFQNQSSNKGGETDGEYKVKDPLWPGYTFDKPPKLRIGVPTKNSSPELVNADNSSERLTIDGFAKNVFLKALDVLPFRLNNYEFVALPNMTYDDILCSQMKEKDLDAIIGDITIVANRTNCVDFTLPYLDSSVAMVVRVKDASTNKLILIKPFNWLLWLLFCLIFAATTAAIYVFLEINRTNQTGEGDETGGGNRTSQTGGGDETRGGNGASQTGGGNGASQIGGGNGASQTSGGNGAGSGTSQPGGGNGTNKTGEGNRNNQTKGEYRFNPFLVYKMDVMEINSTSKAAGWMVILTSFLFIFIVQVYTASLTSILTQAKTKEPLFMDENELKNRSLSVGYQNGSWVRGFLIQQIGFNPSQLKGLTSREEYNSSLSNGTEKEGVDAIFDETPNLTLFLAQYKPHFMMTGPIYQSGGFAFAFPKKSSLALHFSNAILDMVHDVETYRVLMAKSSLPTSIEDLQLQDLK
ncbi:hypothetical protein QN277_025177 [Acacia crassicarpa]|uniref:Ionotropic glutamate receptor C-terminal domain-containing protein n=1 Tax=Acacia crassicarpa TaxID=499986 RepID=A0AAE1JDP6_9FABA|nr:hypothetical protein QN277_025177 [Acacia crassicarpa]